MERVSQLRGPTVPPSIPILTALGTMVGDPIEYRSVQSLFGGPDRQGNLFLGSVKDNIGHCEAASGVAGVIKTLLMMRYGQIPKQANFERLNPKIEVHGDEDKIVIPTKSMPWKSIRRAALVNNYGAAGSNAALILRQYSTIPPISDFRTDTADGQVTAMKVYPIVLSANSMASLQSNAASLLAYLGHTELDPSQDSEWLDTVAHNIAWRQNCTFGFRAAFEVSSKEDLITALNRVTIDTSIVSTPTESAPIVFCFGGQTGLEVSVSEDLYNNTPAFKYHLVSKSLFSKLSVYLSLC